MSFDVFLLKFSKGGEADMPREPVLKLFKDYNIEKMETGSYLLRRNDTSADVSAYGILGEKRFASMAFWIRRMGDYIVNLMFDCAKATGGVLIPTMEGTPCIMVDITQKAELPDDFKFPQIECQSAADLGRLLRGGYNDWTKYRDHVLSIINSPDPPT